MKIIVYAIAKDEERTARRWAEAVSEADKVIVLDTGSTDRTVEILKDCGVEVFEDYDGPFRFDRARNKALSHVPEDADWCFSVDLDEIFEPGWRAAIDKAALEHPNATQIKYPFVFSHRTDPETGEEVADSWFYKGNCHRRRGFKWVCPCHEVLVSETAPIEAIAEGCRLHHRSEPKARRDGYLQLLEQGAKDDPTDPRVHYYLGREYFYRNRNQEAAEVLVKYLDLVGQYCWHDEKGNALHMIAQCCERLGDLDRAESWALRALAETAGREPYIFLARLYHRQERWWECRHYAEAALKLENNNAYFRDPSAYRATPWDFLCASSFKLGDRHRSKEAAAKCLEFDPENDRYRGNARFFGLLPPEKSEPDKNGTEKGGGKGEFSSGKHASERENSDEKRDDSDQKPPIEEELAVAYSITANFAEHLEVALFSLLQHNKVRDLYLIIEGGNPVPSISRLARRFNVRRVHWFNLDRLLNKGLRPDCPNKNPVCTPATLGRLFLARATWEKKILYLDTDTIVNGSLQELWKQPLDGIALVGTIDQGALKLWGDYTKTLVYGGIPGYLNAGILLMNLELIRRLDLDHAALKLLNETAYNFADQDVLNIACKGRTRAISNRFNSGYACGESKDPVIEHFVTFSDFYKNPNCPSWQKKKEELKRWTDQPVEMEPERLNDLALAGW